MTTYIVTTEIKTSFLLKLLRFFRIKKKRKEFYLTFEANLFKVGDIVIMGNGKELKIIKQVSR